MALSHGAPEAAVDALRTRDVLLNILSEANVEHDIREDVADACEINNLSALALASGLLDVAAVADLCFLTHDEADVRPRLGGDCIFSYGISGGSDSRTWACASRAQLQASDHANARICLPSTGLVMARPACLAMLMSHSLNDIVGRSSSAITLCSHAEVGRAAASAGTGHSHDQRVRGDDADAEQILASPRMQLDDAHSNPAVERLQAATLADSNAAAPDANP